MHVDTTGNASKGVNLGENGVVGKVGNVGKIDDVN